MEFLVEFKVRIPEGTPDAEVRIGNSPRRLRLPTWFIAGT